VEESGKMWKDLEARGKNKNVSSSRGKKAQFPGKELSAPGVNPPTNIQKKFGIIFFLALLSHSQGVAKSNL